MAKKAPQCWCCLKVLDAGVSLDSFGKPHICMTCWRSLPKAKRIQLQLMVRPRAEGGLGLRELIEAVAQGLPSGPAPWSSRAN